jgi:hypothetical protein
VPPPEAVVENFVRELETERYERATGYLSTELQSGIKPEQLRAWTSARLKTERAGEPALKFTLKREEGVWKVNGLISLEDPEVYATP